MYLSLAMLLVFTLVGCKDPVEDKDTYTYNYASSVFPNNWNPHTYQTATDSTILSTTSIPFVTLPNAAYCPSRKGQST